jgi:hypothetical protein
MAVVKQQLEDEGVKSFADAFPALLASIENPARLDKTDK